MSEFEIYFRDLTPEAQKAFLEAAGIKEAKDGNYDVFSITSIELEPETLEIKLYSPLRIAIDRGERWDDEYDEYDFDPDGEYPEISPYEAVEYEHEIAAFFEKELSHDQDEIKYGLMAYYDENDSVKENVKRITVSVEEVDGELMGVATVTAYEPLHDEDMELIKDFLSGQYSDGFGEGAEQRPVKTDEGDLYVSLWQSGRDFFIRTEQEMSGKRRSKQDHCR